MTSRQFTDAFHEFYLPLGMMALRIVGDNGEAEDIVQEAFTAAWQRSEEGLEIDNFNSYIFRTVNNMALSRIRSRKAHPAIDSETLPLETIPDESDDALAYEIEQAELDAAVWREIGKLPQRCREIFLLAKRDGLSYQQIAERLGLSVKTVDNQLGKAMKRLRASFDAADGESSHSYNSSSLLILLPYLAATTLS